MEELIKKVRQYMVDHNIAGFKKSMVDQEIDRYKTDRITRDVFKINVDLLLEINVDDL